MQTASRLLAVDDSATIRKALQLILEPAGFAVEFGATGQEAIDKTKQSLPEVLLLDFILPDMRGTDVCRVLAADPDTAAIPIILISTKGAEIRQAYQDLDNVVYYIAKPFAPDEVTRAIADVLSQSRESRLAKLRARDAAPAQPSPLSAPAAPAAGASSPPLAAGEWPAATDEGAGAVATDGWDDVEGAVTDDDVEIAVANRVRDVTRRETLEAMFETLRSGLEGVYVEEVDTPGGAAADEAKSYTDLASALAQQLVETLAQAQTGAQFGLCRDGSVRSLDDTLHDTFRRVCRLLFRAVGSGAVENQQLVSPTRPRVLVVCRTDSELWERLAPLRGERADWHVFSVCSDVRQLALMTRLYGPHHVVVDAGYGTALWDQLRVVRALPEGQRVHVLGVVRPREDGGAAAAADTLAALGVEVVDDPGYGLLDLVCARIEHPDTGGSRTVGAAIAQAANA
jgi:CheY-like chemotaxis protein